MFWDSFKGLEKERLSFVTDATGTVHLLDNIVSHAYLKKNNPTYTPENKAYIFINGKRYRIINCTGLGLTGTEENNLTLEDF